MPLLRYLFAASMLLLALACGTLRDTASPEYVKASVLARELEVLANGQVVAPKDFTNEFPLEGSVYVYTVFHWPDRKSRSVNGGYAWYTGSELVAETSEFRYRRTRPPATSVGQIAALALGPGSHRVEVLLWGKVVAEHEFTILEP